MQRVTRTEKKVIEKLVALLAEREVSPKATEVAEELGISRARGAQVLKQLEVKGYVARDGLRSGYYPTESYLSERGVRAEKEVRIEGGQGRLPILFLGSVVAGRPLDAMPAETYMDVADMVPVGENVFSLKVSGFSMKNAGIVDGDIIICEKTQVADDGDIVVALLPDGTSTLKRLQRNKDKGKVYLMPENEKFEPIELDEVTIQGKLILSLRSYEVH